MRIDRINEGGCAIPFQATSRLTELTINDLSVVRDPAAASHAPWSQIRMSPVLQMKIAHTGIARFTALEAPINNPSWFALVAGEGRVKALASMWQTEVCLHPDELLIALQDPTGRVRSALTQPWRSRILEVEGRGSVSETEIARLLTPEDLICIGQERRSGMPAVVDLYIAERLS